MIHFTSNELLAKAGVPLSGTRLLQHDRTALQEWRKSPDHFDHHVSYRRSDGRTACHNAQFAIQFVPHGPNGAHLEGDHPDTPNRRPRCYLRQSGRYDDNGHDRCCDLSCHVGMATLFRRVVIDRGPATCRWSQRAERHDKPILEWRASDKTSPHHLCSGKYPRPIALKWFACKT